MSIVSGRTSEDRFNEKWLWSTGDCWIWVAAVNSAGYGRFENGLAHRRSYEMHCGCIPPGALVLHKCHVKRCVNPAHLYIGDHQQNMWDAINVGAWKCGPRDGENNGRSKLTAKDVVEIRRMFPAMTRAAIAEQFDVSPTTIGKIVRRESWTSV